MDRPPKHHRRILRAGLWGMTAVVALATLAGYLGRLSWRIELACHFRVQYFWLLAAATAMLILRKHYKRALVPGFFVAVNLIELVPLYVPTAPPRGPVGETIRAVAVNVHISNRQHDRVLKFIEAAGADVVLLTEVDAAWDAALRPLQKAYPYSHTAARDDNFGIALYSRIAFELDELYLGEAGVPSLVARFTVDRQTMTLIGTHLLPPRRTDYARMRNDQLDRLVEVVGRQQEPVVFLGDLNVTSWSPFFRDFIRRTGLKDSRRGFGVQASWPVSLPVARIPIDHCLVSPSVKVLDREIGQNVGSDHFPMIVDFAITKHQQTDG